MVSIDVDSHVRVYPFARLLLGVTLTSAALGIAGFFLGSSAASADETTPVAPPASTVSSLLPGLGSALGSVTSGVVDTLDSTLGAVTDAAQAVVPAPIAPVVDEVVTQVVEPITTPVTDVVASVADAQPVTAVVAPVAGLVDSVVAAVPATDALLGPAPIASLLSPAAASVDRALAVPGQVLGGVGDIGSGATDGTGPTDVPIALPGLGALDASSLLGTAVPAAAATATAIRADRLVTGVQPGAAPGVGADGASASPPTAPPVRPNVPGPGDAPPATPAAPSSAGGFGSSAHGGALAGAADVLAGSDLPDPSTALFDRPADDRLPASPVAAHDTTPG